MLSILPDVIIYSLFRKRTPKNVSMFCSIVVCSCFSNTTVEEVRSFTTVPTSKSFISDTAISPSLSQDICSLYRTFLQNTIVKHSFRRHSHQKRPQLRKAVTFSQYYQYAISDTPSSPVQRLPESLVPDPVRKDPHHILPGPCLFLSVTGSLPGLP